jgi:hypothetical protein
MSGSYFIEMLYMFLICVKSGCDCYDTYALIKRQFSDYGQCLTVSGNQWVCDVASECIYPLYYRVFRGGVKVICLKPTGCECDYGTVDTPNWQKWNFTNRDCPSGRVRCYQQGMCQANFFANEIPVEAPPRTPKRTLIASTAPRTPLPSTPPQTYTYTYTNTLSPSSGTKYVGFWETLKQWFGF